MKVASILERCQTTAVLVGPFFAFYCRSGFQSLGLTDGKRQDAVAIALLTHSCLRTVTCYLSGRSLF